jgi:hypothetical protein
LLIDVIEEKSVACYLFLMIFDTIKITMKLQSAEGRRGIVLKVDMLIRCREQDNFALVIVSSKINFYTTGTLE